jgi:light-regulated signal transduction histidine kinase (bacteriophytochrome)
MSDATSEGRRRALLDAEHIDLDRVHRELEAFGHLVAHDLKSPLQVIAGFLELLQDHSNDQLDDLARSYITEARRGAARMQLLIDDLLMTALTAEPTRARQPVDLEGVFAEALADCLPAAGVSDADVRVGALPHVDGDAFMLRRLFANLISNSLKFRRRGVIPSVEIDAVPTEGGWTVRVTDNGIGVRAEHRDEVFTMFKRVGEAEDAPGSGIGLAICQRIVTAHGGRIWIGEGHDGGAQVCFTLPA